MMKRRCSVCGVEVDDQVKFCPNCGTKIDELEKKIKNENQQLVEETLEEEKVEKKQEEKRDKASKESKDDDEFWPSYTEDKYRNEIVKSVRISNVIGGLLAILCFWQAWRYKEYYGWGGVFGGFVLNLIVVGILLWILGFEKYFGDKRLKRYDVLVSTAGQTAAVAAMEAKKGGTIRKILIGLAILCSVPITEGICMGMAEDKIHSEMAANEDLGDVNNSISLEEMESDDSITGEDEAEHVAEETQAASTNFQIGEAVSTNLFEFTITNAYVVDDLGENKKIPEGAIYVAIEYEFKNISKQPISSWDLPDVKLVDGNDAIYSQDMDADWYFDAYSDSKIMSDMNPGIKTKNASIFEVAIEVLNAGGMRAYVTADQEFLVDLPLTYEKIPENVYDEGYLGNAKADGYYEEMGDSGYGYILEGSDTRYLSSDEIYALSQDELRLARNEIFARHGRLFDSEDLQSYFNSMDWYSGTIPANQFDESVLNEYEKANLDLIKAVEAGTGGEITAGFYVDTNEETTLSISIYSSPEDEKIGSIERNYGYGYEQFIILESSSSTYELLDSMANLCGTITVVGKNQVDFEIYGDVIRYTCVEQYVS